MSYFSFNLCAGLPKNIMVSSEDFRENNREGIETGTPAGRLSSLPNIIDPTTRMEHRRSKFSKKWATIDGSLGNCYAHYK